MYEQETKKHTKIVATISDRKCDVEFLKSLYKKGMNVVRINTAHQQPEDSLKIIENVREVSDKIPILIDTKGPEVRTVKSEGMIELTAGDQVKITGNTELPSTKEQINVSYNKFTEEVEIGKSILIDDGLIELTVLSKEHDALICKVNNSESFEGRKSVNVPGANLNLPTLTEKDKLFVKFAAEQGVAFIAHSFVRNKKDVLAVKELLGDSNVQIIAKIENQEGVDNIQEILDNTYGIMVARGDLAVEIPGPKVPTVQKQLIRAAKKAKKVSIVATQMLHTMIDNPRPTRAEMNDVANAIYDKADAIMLSGETAYGKYPEQAVKYMTRIAEEVEAEIAQHRIYLPQEDEYEIPDYLSIAAVHAATKIDVKAIVTDTTYGTTPSKVASFRGPTPVYSFCYNRQTMRQLALNRSIYAEYMEPVSSSDEFVSKAMKSILQHKLVSENDKIIAIAGNFEPSHGASFIEISTVKNLKRS